MPITTAIIDEQNLKELRSRQLAQRLLGDVVDSWPVEDVFEYLEADGYEWLDLVWYPAADELVQLVPSD